MRIEIHEDGHVYGYEQSKDDPFEWDFYVDGQHMPRSSEGTDGRDVLWQMALTILKGVNS